MNAVRVQWSDASFLVYFGGLTILAAAIALLSIESGDHAAGAFVALSLSVFVVVMLLAFTARRAGNLITAGLYALTGVVRFVIFFGALPHLFRGRPPPDGGLFQ